MIWNAQSIRKKRFEFFKFLDKNSLDIILVSETYLTHCDTFTNPNYFTYRLDRDDGRRGGGVAILVRKDIEHKLLPCVGTKVIESLSIQIRISNRSFTIHSVYFPGSNDPFILRQFKTDLDLLTSRSNFIIGGDLNSRHVSWKCQRNNAAGRILNNIVEGDDLLVHFPDTPTHFPHCGNLPSTIDLFITKGFPNPLYPTTDNSLHSDHVPVLTTLEFHIERQKLRNNAPRDYFRADWKGYRRFIELNIATDASTTALHNENEIDAAIENFTDLILKAEDQFVPLKPIHQHTTQLPREICALIGLRRAKLRRLRRTNDRTIKAEIDLLNVRIDHLTKDHVNKQFSKSIEKINEDPGPNRRKFWKLTRFMKNRPKQIPAITNEGAKLITEEEKAVAFADHFKSVHEATETHLGRDVTSKNIKNSLNHIETSIVEDSTVPLIQRSTLVSIISTLRNTKAPGLDRVNNRHLKQLPLAAVELLGNIFNACLRISYFPMNWKKSKMRCICKPGKPPTAIASYRPISLLSCISKLFERIILELMNIHIADNNVILPQQFGFRPGKSCTHQLYRITNNIRTDLKAKKSIGMLSIDLKAAFDSVWHDALIHKLHSNGFPMFLTKIIQSFLFGRTFQVAIGRTLTTEYDVTAGVPQGAVLSPTLFNIFLSDIPTNFQADLAQFADDTALLATSHSTKAIVRKLQMASNRLCGFFHRWRIRVNGPKSESIIFTRKRAARHRPQSCVQVNGVDVTWGRTLKYLGLQLDPKLTFQSHTEFILEKFNKLIKSLYPLIHRNSKLSTTNKVLIFKTIFRPTLTYAAPVWGSCAASHRKKLQIAQNKVLKIILDVPRRTPTTEIHDALKLDLFNDHLDRLNFNFISNCRVNVNPDINSLIA